MTSSIRSAIETALVEEFGDLPAGGSVQYERAIDVVTAVLERRERELADKVADEVAAHVGVVREEVRARLTAAGFTPEEEEVGDVPQWEREFLHVMHGGEEGEGAPKSDDASLEEVVAEVRREVRALGDRVSRLEGLAERLERGL